MKKFLGLEFGSTRIKAVLIDEKHELLASGGCAWENRLENGVWFNLYNNMWNTNFPMWYDEDALFRFRIRVGREM